MEFSDSYFTADGHFYKVSCNRAYNGEKDGYSCLFVEMKVEEVEYTV